MGTGVYGNQSDSIRGAPVKWNKKTKRYEEKLAEEKIDWAMTHKYRLRQKLKMSFRLLSYMWHLQSILCSARIQ